MLSSSVLYLFLHTHPLPKVYDIMRVHGACIVDDFFDATTKKGNMKGKAPLFTCDKRQAEYILQKNIPRKEIFNGVIKLSKSAVYKTHLTHCATKNIRKDGPRFMLKNCPRNNTAMEEYQIQMDLLLQHIFREGDFKKSKPENWITKMQNIVGGNTYQHAHSDCGRFHEYKEESTFPFVATHGFGMFPFELWLLPTAKGGKAKHGFLHRFTKTSILFMRGDFVHAGGVLTDPRCHMSFFPRPKAGLVHNHKHHYWLQPEFARNIDNPPRDTNATNDDKDTTETTFLWQSLTFPFAYPVRTFVKNKRGHLRTLLTYPPHVTSDIVSTQKTPQREITWLTVNAQRF